MRVWAVSLLTMELSPHSLTPSTGLRYSEFDWKIRITPRNPIQCSTPADTTTQASPKAISGRTSYYQARLAFHCLPQVIPRSCTTYGFGLPPVFRPNSSCPR